MHSPIFAEAAKAMLMIGAVAAFAGSAAAAPGSKKFCGHKSLSATVTGPAVGSYVLKQKAMQAWTERHGYSAAISIQQHFSCKDVHPHQMECTFTAKPCWTVSYKKPQLTPHKAFTPPPIRFMPRAGRPSANAPLVRALRRR